MGTSYPYRKIGVGHTGVSIAGRYNHDGYIMLLLTDGTRTLEHRYVMEGILGRALSQDEVVHHLDGNKSHNDPSNLELQTNEEHARHHANTVERLSTNCSICGKEVLRTESKLRNNAKRKSVTTCSKHCAGLVGKSAVAATAPHGTVTAYAKCGPPRCSLCRGAMAAYRKRLALEKITRG